MIRRYLPGELESYLERGGARLREIDTILGSQPQETAESKKPTLTAREERLTRWISGKTVPIPSNLRNVFEQAAQRQGIPIEAVTARGNLREQVEARREVAVYLRTIRRWSLPRIGRVLGGWHHTTVLNLLRGRGHCGEARASFRAPREPNKITITCPDLSGEWAI